MKYFYIVYTCEQDKNAESIVTGERRAPDCSPGLYASVMRVSDQDNLLSRLGMLSGLKYAHICQSKRFAENVAKMWNDSYKRNGTYFFD